MRKILGITILLSLFLCLGCGGDDEIVDPPVPNPKVTANKTVGSPALTNPQDSRWDMVDAVTIDLSGANAPKLGVSKAFAVSDSISVQAIVSNDSLFLKLVWDDDSHNVWRDYFEITDVGPPILFQQNNTLPNDYEEDQIFLMFDGAPDGGWDVWNWRVLTTGSVNLGEGFRYNTTMVRDAGQITTAIVNPTPFGVQPRYVHEDTSEFNSHALYLTEYVDYLLDTTIYGNYINLSTGWSVGQKVPGWVVDNTAKDRQETERNSRLDIGAVESYNPIAGEYILIIWRKLNTGYADDLAMSTGSTFTMKIAVLNNQNTFTTGSSNRSFTKDIDLEL